MDQNRAIQPFNSQLAQQWAAYYQALEQDRQRKEQEIIAQANAAIAATRQQTLNTQVHAAQEIARRVAVLEQQKRQGEEAG